MKVVNETCVVDEETTDYKARIANKFIFSQFCYLCLKITMGKAEFAKFGKYILSLEFLFLQFLSYVKSEKGMVFLFYHIAFSTLYSMPLSVVIKSLFDCGNVIILDYLRKLL